MPLLELPEERCGPESLTLLSMPHHRSVSIQTAENMYGIWNVSCDKTIQ